MYTFLVVVMALVGVLLGVVVLLQSGKGGGLAASFGGSGSSTDTFLGGRQAATLLTKASWTLGGVFLGLAIILSIMSAQSREPTSVLEGEFQPAATPQEAAPAPLLPLTPAESVPAEGGGQTPPSPIQPEGSGQPEGPGNP